MTKKYLIKDLLPNDEVKILYAPTEHKMSESNLDEFLKREIANDLELNLDYFEISIPKGTNQIQIKEIHDNED